MRRPRITSYNVCYTKLLRSAVAVATLINAVKTGLVKKDDCIMLNITGGGEERFKSDKEITYLKPSYVFDINPSQDLVKEVMDKLFK